MRSRPRDRYTDLLALRAETAKKVEELVVLKSELTYRAGGGGARTGGPFNKGSWAWKNKAPEEGKPTAKDYKGKSYVNCPFHGKKYWVLAKGHAKGCRLDPDYKKGTGSAPTTPKRQQPASPTKKKVDNSKLIKYARAMMNAMENDVDEGRDDDDAYDDEDLDFGEDDG